MSQADVQPKIPVAEYAERRAHAATKARELGYRGLIVWSRGGATYDNFGDVLYLTNSLRAVPVDQRQAAALDRS